MLVFQIEQFLIVFAVNDNELLQDGGPKVVVMTIKVVSLRGNPHVDLVFWRM